MQKQFFHSHGSLIRIISHFSHERRAPSSSCSCSATIPKLSAHVAVADEDEGPGCSRPLYLRRLRTQMPGTIQHRRRLENYASFIGRVDRPIVVKSTKSGSIGACSSLQVTNSEDVNGDFRIHMEMWDAMAKMCIQHLKLGDFVHVSGCLLSFENADASGNCELHHKITVKSLNYVQAFSNHLKSQLESGKKDGPHCHQDVDGTGEGRKVRKWWESYFAEPQEWWDNRKSKISPGSADFKHKRTGERVWLSPDDPPWIRKKMELLDSKMMTDPRYENRLYLWHVFFANPWEWWDNRKNKKNPRAPDFKNKCTGESLWLHPTDPPWIQKQLTHVDAKMEEKRNASGSSDFTFSRFFSLSSDT